MEKTEKLSSGAEFRAAELRVTLRYLMALPNECLMGLEKSAWWKLTMLHQWLGCKMRQGRKPGGSGWREGGEGRVEIKYTKQDNNQVAF